MCSKTRDCLRLQSGKMLIGLCALALALQGIATLVVDLPGCIEVGGAAQSSV